MSSKISIVITTTDNKKIANNIASYLIENKLAACVQMDEVLSFFKWEGRTQQTKEFRLMIKTLSDKYSDAEKAILKHHNYSLPQVIKIDVDSGFDSYLNWVRDEVE
jgi:periplasmic divalent cation tolerance protein